MNYDYINYDYVKWIDNLKIGSKVLYSNGTESWIEKIQYELYENGIWFKKFCTAHGDNFDFRGCSKIGDEYVIFVKEKY